MSKKNRICLNFHIFKNAGGTIEWILEKNFGKNFAMTAYGTGVGVGIPFRPILDYLINNSSIQAFSSHGLRFPLIDNPSMEFLPFVSIRHPIDRIFSTYEHNKRTNQQSKAAKVAKESDIEEYIRWVLKTKWPPGHNGQTRFLAGRVEKSMRQLREKASQVLSDKFGKPKNEWKEIAVRIINEAPVLIIVDKFDESMIVAEEKLKEFFPTIDLAYRKTHVSKNRSNILSEKIEKGKSEIGIELYSKLKECNKMDLELYTAASNELESRIKKIKSFDVKLDDFRNRCNQLSDEIKIKGKRLDYDFKNEILTELSSN